MLGHDDVAVDLEVVALAGLLKDGLEDLFGGAGVEVRVTVVAAEEGDVVEVAGLVTAFQAGWHLGDFSRSFLSE